MGEGILGTSPSLLHAAMALVGPGALQEYSAPSEAGEPEAGYVDDPAVGFFVAGSSIDDLNGIYVDEQPRLRRTTPRWPTRPRGGWTLAPARRGRRFQ